MVLLAGRPDLRPIVASSPPTQRISRYIVDKVRGRVMWGGGGVLWASAAPSQCRHTQPATLPRSGFAWKDGHQLVSCASPLSFVTRPDSPHIHAVLSWLSQLQGGGGWARRPNNGMGPTEGVLLQATIPMAGGSCRAGDSEGVGLLPIAVVFGWGGGRNRR